MSEKASERVVPPLNFSKVVNSEEISDAGVKALLRETNFECQEILLFSEPVCMRYNGTIRAFYDSFECGHPDTLAFGALQSLATCQHAKLSSKRFSSLMT